MAVRLAAAALALPLALFGALLLFPAADSSWGTSSFHFYVVSAASLLAAGTCVILIASARSIRETRILFLALSFFCLGMVFAVHGLATPGHLYDHPTAAVQRSPWLATLAAGGFATLSVVPIPQFTERARLRLPEITFALFAALTVTYFVVNLANPNFLEGFPTQSESFQHFLTVVTIALLAFPAWRYFESHLFTRLPSQLAVVTGLFFIAEAQLSMDFGRFWAYSWWMYHGLFLAAFSSVLGGFAWELLRARNASSIAEAIAMRDALQQLNRGRPSPLITLADQIENHDLATFRHVDRVAACAYAIGKDMGFGPGRLRDLVLAAQMHDIGKIGLPPYILTKPGALSDEEWAMIKLHPGKGFEIVSRLPALRGLAAVIRHHHERYDGSGYPDGLCGDAIPLEARIVSVADTFDALTSERPYRGAMSIPEARAELQRVAGAQLDPNCVQALLRALDNGGIARTCAPDAATVPVETTA
jgi:HD-GYP domain-containing protein (c-di-GMP phosphodiesterase class II)